MAITGKYAHTIIMDDPIIKVISTYSGSGTHILWVQYPLLLDEITIDKVIETKLEKHEKKKPYYRKNQRW